TGEGGFPVRSGRGAAIGWARIRPHPEERACDRGAAKSGRACASRRMRTGESSCKPGLRRFLFSSCFLLLSMAIRAEPLGADRAHFLLSSWSLRESHRRQLCPASCFSPVVYRKTGAPNGSSRERDP